MKDSAAVDAIRKRFGSVPPVSFTITDLDGRETAFGQGEPEFQLKICNQRGWKAVRSLDELRICEAYMNEDIDITGDLRRAATLRWSLQEENLLITAWKRIQPLLIGLDRANKKWVQNHYDANNIQLYFVDNDYQTYTPGVFTDPEEALETASERKHRLAFEGTGLKPGDRILDIGFGWGSFLRYACRRGVHVTGLTLSRHQLRHVQEKLIDQEGLSANLIYTDFFNYEPTEEFDGIVILGVIEELADYDRILERISKWLKPGKKVYLDFMAMNRQVSFPAFITKYVYQGRTRRVYLPNFVEAVAKSPFEITAIYNDRLNYFLTVNKWFERFEANQQEIRKQFGERLYRMFRLYLAGNPDMLSHASHLTTAFRVFMELPKDRVAVSA